MTTRLLAVALLFGLLVGVPLAGAPAAARQDDQLQIAFSVPGLNFPFFVHMVNIARDKAEELESMASSSHRRTSRRSPQLSRRRLTPTSRW
jgi:ABC-type sugar transport system substrate-binding protein